MQSFRPEQAGSTRQDGRATTATVLQAGTEWLVDAAGCDPSQLSDLCRLQDICGELVEALRLRVLGAPHWHQFPNLEDDDQPGGVTGLYLLAESHLTCHTFPEQGRAAFNLYCCRRRPDWDWQEFLGRRLGATHVIARCVPRGPAELNTFRCEGQP